MKISFFKPLFIAVMATLLVCVNVNAQKIDNPYWPGTITLKDGTIKDGWIKIPSFSREKKIEFPVTKKDVIENINREDIATLSITSERGYEYWFENVPVVNTIKGNTSLGTLLLLVAAKNNYVTFYVQSQRYTVDDETGKILLYYRYRQGYDFPTTTYYIRKKDAEKANLFYVTEHLAGIKKGLTYHLTEDPDLIKRVENKELTSDDIEEIITTYISTTKNM